MLKPEDVKELIKAALYIKELKIEHPHIDTLAEEICNIANSEQLNLSEEQRKELAKLLAKLEAYDWLQYEILLEIARIDSKLVQPCSAIAIRMPLYLMTPAAMSRILRYILRKQNRDIEELISHLRRSNQGSDDILDYIR